MTSADHQNLIPSTAAPANTPVPPALACGLTTLWLVRHAEVEEAYRDVFGGRIDMGLSTEGHRQAAALAAYLQGKKFDAVYASPMKRVQQTLTACQGNGLPLPVTLPELREVDFGDWTGLRWAEVQLKYGISPLSWLDQLEGKTIQNAECAADLRSRVEPIIREVLSRHRSQEVAVFCHGGVIRMLLAILLDWPFSKFASTEIDYASLTQLIFRDARCRIQLLNFSPWRDLRA